MKPVVNGSVLVRSGRPKLDTQEARVAAYYRKRDKNPMEMARMLRDLVEATGNRQSAMAVGLSDASISNYLGLLRLPDDMKVAVRERRLGYKAARALSRLPHHKCKQVWAFMKREGLVAGDVERMCSLAMQHPSKTPQELWDLSKGRPVKGKAAPPRVINYTRKPVEKMAQVKPDDLMAVAGYVEGLSPASDIEKLPLLTTLRVLNKRVEAKIRELS